MQTKQHRVNSDFDLRYFLAGSCSTPDGAWALLYGQQIDMQQRINSAEAAILRHRALEARARRAEPESPEHFEALADLKAAELNAEISGRNLAGARAELATIERMMAQLEPHCQHSDLPLLERLEACKRDEWAGELTRRAENMMLGNVLGIPYDHVDAMRQHPDFADKILPRMMQTAALIGQAQKSGDGKLIEQALAKPAALPFLE